MASGTHRYGILVLPILLAFGTATGCSTRHPLRIRIPRGSLSRIAVMPPLGERRASAYAFDRIRADLGRAPGFGWVEPKEAHDSELRASVTLTRIPYPPELAQGRFREREGRTRVDLTLLRLNDDRIVWRDGFEASWFGDEATDDWKESVDLAVSVMIDKLKEDLAPVQ